MSYKRYTVSCLLCKSEVGTSNLSAHYNSKQCKFGGKASLVGQFKILKPKNKWIPELRICPVCDTEYMPLSRRQYRCSTGCKHKFTPQRRANLSISMKLAVENHPQSYAGGYNRGRIKTVVCSNGFVVLGNWEKIFVEFCIKKNIQIEQPNTGFSYSWNGERTYFPDFYIPHLDLWVEVKGYKTERDMAKWNSMEENHNKRLLIIDKSNINNLEIMVPLLGFDPSTKELF